MDNDLRAASPAIWIDGNACAADERAIYIPTDTRLIALRARPAIS
jgi:hypothetical protein